MWSGRANRSSTCFDLVSRVANDGRLLSPACQVLLCPFAFLTRICLYTDDACTIRVRILLVDAKYSMVDPLSAVAATSTTTTGATLTAAGPMSACPAQCRRSSMQGSRCRRNQFNLFRNIGVAPRPQFHAFPMLLRLIRFCPAFRHVPRASLTRRQFRHSAGCMCPTVSLVVGLTIPSYATNHKEGSNSFPHRPRSSLLPSSPSSPPFPIPPLRFHPSHSLFPALVPFLYSVITSLLSYDISHIAFTRSVYPCVCASSVFGIGAVRSRALASFKCWRTPAPHVFGKRDRQVSIFPDKLRKHQ